MLRSGARANQQESGKAVATGLLKRLGEGWGNDIPRPAKAGTGGLWAAWQPGFAAKSGTIRKPARWFWCDVSLYIV